MSKSTYGVVGFIIGAAVGTLVSWKLLEKKYADIADEEIASVKEAYRRKTLEKKDENDTNDTTEETIVVEMNEDNEGSDILESYTSAEPREDYSSYSANKQETNTTTNDGPYVISPEEYSGFDEYEVIELTYYRNGVLLDDEGEPIENPELIVGDFESHFGEYEDDCVIVRNDAHRCDYQILFRDEDY